MELIFTTEKIALGLAHAVYRNTKIEDYHSIDRTMDENLYNDVYKIVDQKMRRVLSNKEKIQYLHNKDMSLFVNKNEMAKIYDPIIGDIIFGIQCSSGWDDPVEISERPDENPARYLLNGEFKNHCDGKNIFDDSVMKTINKDIANRSLMILKYIILA